MVTQMAKYLDTVYVSGWQSSSTASASDEPGPDLADYPYVRWYYSIHIYYSSWLIFFFPDHCAQQSWPSLYRPTFP